MAHGEKFWAQWNDNGGTVHEIKLLQEGGSGTTEIEFTQTVPYTYQGRGDKDFPITDQIAGSEITFNFIAPAADIATFDAIFESDYKEWKVEHYYNTVLDWTGWLQPENRSRDYVEIGNYYLISLSATDGLANLKSVEFVNATDGTQYADRVSIMTTIKRALEHTGIELNFKVQLGTWCTNDSLMVSTDCALDKATCDSRRFIKSKEGRLVNTNCYEVISELLEPFNCYLRQSLGEYWIINAREYDAYVFSILWATITTITSRTASDLIINIDGVECFRGNGELQSIRPLETVGMTFRDRNVGDTLLSNGDFSTASTSEWVAGADLNQFQTVAFEDDYELMATVNIAADGVPVGTPNFYSVAQAITIRGEADKIQVQYKLRCPAITMDGAWSGDSFNERVKISCRARYASPTGTIMPASNTQSVIVGSDQSAYTLYANSFDIVDTGNYYIEFEIEKMSANVWSNYDYIEIRLDDIFIAAKYSTGEDITFDRYFKVTNTDSVFKDTEEIELNFGDSLSDSDIAAFKIAGTRTATWSRYGKSENTSLNFLAPQNIIENYAKYKDYLRLTIIDDTDRIFPHSILRTGAPATSVFYQIVDQQATFSGGGRKELQVQLVEILNTAVTTSVVEIGLSSVDGDSSSSVAFSQGVINPGGDPVDVGVTDHGALTGLADDDHPQYLQNTDLAQGNTWFLDANNGSDTNIGSAQEKLQTIPAALALAANGDTFNLMPGFYSDNFTLDKDIFFTCSSNWNYSLAADIDPTTITLSGGRQLQLNNIYFDPTNIVEAASDTNEIWASNSYVELNNTSSANWGDVRFDNCEKIFGAFTTSGRITIFGGSSSATSITMTGTVPAFVNGEFTITGNFTTGGGAATGVWVKNGAIAIGGNVNFGSGSFHIRNSTYTVAETTTAGADDVINQSSSPDALYFSAVKKVEATAAGSTSTGIVTIEGGTDDAPLVVESTDSTVGINLSDDTTGDARLVSRLGDSTSFYSNGVSQITLSPTFAVFRYAGVNKLETTSTGSATTGTHNATTLQEGGANINTIYQAINQANFGAQTTKALSGGVAASGINRNLLITSETGSVDDMIELTGLTIGDKVLLRSATGHTITVKHNDAGATIKILIQDNAHFVLDGQHPLELILVDTNELAQVYDETGAGGGGLLAANNLSDVNSAVTSLVNLGLTAIAAEINLLDLSGLTAGWVLSADTATTASWKAPATGSLTLLTKEINIGDWNMDSTPTQTVTHGISSGRSKLRTWHAIIRNDADTVSLNLEGGSASGGPWGSIGGITDTTIDLSRGALGPFDSTDYDNASSYNRGILTIQYIA